MNKSSSNIASIAYVAATGTLTVTFVRGSRVYVYECVPVDVYRAFESAPSQGKFFHEQIKDKYKFKELQHG